MTNMANKSQVLAFTLLAANTILADGTVFPSKRDGKAFGLFSIIRFANAPCAGTGNRNGTCYTETECSDKKGISAGTCASGYGICCAFSITCGQTSSENCTYFDSASVPLGACRVKICKCNDNVCQLRLDFNSFVIAGPSTLRFDVGTQSNGIVISTGAAPVTGATRCVTDRFSVTNPGSSTPPTICGTITGEHMYVDASVACNELAFQLGSSSSVNRQWSIKITQYSCDYDNLAPGGCTQYHFGNNAGVVKSFNYDGGVHLANQEQKICFRQERGNCQVCYFPVLETDFIVSGPEDGGMGITAATSCCGYGFAGSGNGGYDCLVIPGALKFGMAEPASASQFCGEKLVTDNKAENATICTRQRPFHITFRSDNFEHSAESLDKVNPGFRLAFSQQSC